MEWKYLFNEEYEMGIIFIKFEKKKIESYLTKFANKITKMPQSR